MSFTVPSSAAMPSLLQFPADGASSPLAAALPTKAASVAFRRGRQSSTVRASVAAFPEAIPVANTSSSVSLYEILKVERRASLGEIKAAYRRLAKIHHPDVEEGGGDYFMEIREAYETLSDPGARALYDLSLAGMGRGSGGGYYYSTRRWETDQCW